MSVIPRGRPFTVEDLATMPDDGNRYELIDGTLIVSPAPGARHQKIVAKLVVALDRACPPDLHVLPAPFAVRVSRSTELQPDVLVARDEDVTEKLLPGPPVLAVEVSSPSSALHDLNNKKAAYERMGVPSYWVVDPQQSAVTVFELVDGKYDQESHDSEVLAVTLPFPVRVTLGTLA